MAHEPILHRSTKVIGSTYTTIHVRNSGDIPCLAFWINTLWRSFPKKFDIVTTWYHENIHRTTFYTLLVCRALIPSGNLSIEQRFLRREPSLAVCKYPLYKNEERKPFLLSSREAQNSTVLGRPVLLPFFWCLRSASLFSAVLYYCWHCPEWCVSQNTGSFFRITIFGNIFMRPGPLSLLKHLKKI